MRRPRTRSAETFLKMAQSLVLRDLLTFEGEKRVGLRVDGNPPDRSTFAVARLDEDGTVAVARVFETELDRDPDAALHLVYMTDEDFALFRAVVSTHMPDLQRSQSRRMTDIDRPTAGSPSLSSGARTPMEVDSMARKKPWTRIAVTTSTSQFRLLSEYSEDALLHIPLDREPPKVWASMFGRQSRYAGFVLGSQIRALLRGRQDVTEFLKSIEAAVEATNEEYEETFVNPVKSFEKQLANARTRADARLAEIQAAIKRRK